MGMYTSCNDKEEEVKDTPWRELERTVEDSYPREKLYVIGNLDGRVGDRIEKERLVDLGKQA